VLDLDNTFVDRYNHELVDINRIGSEKTAGHRAHLRTMIEEFVQETGSAWGRHILDNFADMVERFWLVKPKATEIDTLLDTLENAA